MISSLDLIDGRGPGFPRPRAAKIFGPFFSPQNILFPLKTYYMCVYIHIHIHIYVCEQRAEDLLYVFHQQLDQVFSS